MQQPFVLFEIVGKTSSYNGSSQFVSGLSPNHLDSCRRSYETYRSLLSPDSAYAHTDGLAGALYGREFRLKKKLRTGLYH